MGALRGWRVAAWAFALAACGESRLPPKVAARPDGQGWFCWHNKRTKHSSSCQRTQDACEGSRRKALAGKSPSEATAYDECVPQGSAGCFTHKDATGAEAWYCAANYEDCESTARTLGRDPEHAADFQDMSQCATWE